MNNALQLEKRIKEHKRIDGFVGGGSNPKPVPITIPVGTKFAYSYTDNLDELVDLVTPISNQYTDMSYMFDHCSNLESSLATDIGSWDVSNVTDTSYMFRNCSSLTVLDLSGWTKTHLSGGYNANMDRMFSGCSGLTYLDFGLSDYAEGRFYPTSTAFMFQGCTNLSYLDLSGIRLGYGVFPVTSYGGMFGSGNQTIPADCEILVYNGVDLGWIEEHFDWLTNVHIKGSV